MTRGYGLLKGVNAMKRSMIAQALAAGLAIMLILTVLLFSASCFSVHPLSSGISGVVLLGPLKPVVKEGEINDRPYPDALIWVMDEAGSRRIESFISDDQGYFKISLLPGTYLLEPQTPRGQVLPRGEPQTVTVLADQYTDITLHYDTGIR
jgi:hypothetical protein